MVFGLGPLSRWNSTNPPADRDMNRGSAMHSRKLIRTCLHTKTIYGDEHRVFS
jgi:hypothetical protein